MIQAQATMRLICFSLLITLFHFAGRAQAFAWATAMGGPAVGFTPNDRGNSIKIDAAGNVYTVGQFVGSVDFNIGAGVFNMTAMNGSLTGWDMFVQKLDANGNFIWAKQLIGDSSSSGYGLAIDASSNVYITGYFRGTKDFDPGSGTYNLTSKGNADIYVLKLDVNGNFLWAKSIGGISNEGGFGISLDNLGNVYITGRFEGTVDFDPSAAINNLSSIGNFDVFVCKLNSSGSLEWAVTTGSAFADYGNAIAIDPVGNIYVTGWSGSADFDPGPGTFILSDGGAFVWKLDVAGNLIWAKQAVGDLGVYGYGIAIDNAGNLVYTGSFWGTVDFDPGAGVLNYSTTSNRDIFISKLDPSGNLIWAKQIGGNNEEECFSIALDQNFNIYITGYFQGLVDFDPGPGVYNLNANDWNTFIEKFDNSGNFVWAASMVGSSSRGYGVTLNSTNIYYTGEFSGIVDFNPSSGVFNLTALGGNDIFIQKLTQTPCAVPPPPGTIAGNTNVNVGQTINYSISPVNGATGYNWSLSGGGTIISGQNTTSVSINWTSAGGYALFVNAANNCGLSSNQNLGVTVSAITAVINPDNQFQIKITPNPSNGEFYFKAKGVINKNIEIDITNKLGQIVFTNQQRANVNEFSKLLDLSKMAAGIYNVRVIINSKIYSRSIIKSN